MPKSHHLLVLTDRPDVLERVYESPLASAFTVTLAANVEQFQQFAKRFAFSGYAWDANLTGAQTWSLFQDIKVRRPAVFFGLLLGRTADDGVRSLISEPEGGWFALHPPYPAAEIALLKNHLAKTTVLSLESSDASPTPAFQELRAVFDEVKARKVPSVKDAVDALAAAPNALIVFHAARPETSHGAFLREVAQASPKARVLFIFDQTLEEATRAAIHNNGWVALPPPNGLPFMLDRLQETSARPESGKPPLERLLVVDDEPNILEFIVDILSEQGYEVEGYPSGTSAVAAAKTKEFHVALVDFQLGDMTGLTLSRELRQNDPDLNVILMTAHASLDMAVKAIQADVYDYLIKPVDTNHLKRSIGKALEKRRLALEIKALVADLQKANHQLNRLNDLKSRFLSIVTHDLRTPLTSIKGYSQVLVMQPNLPGDQQQHFLKVIAHETDHLAGLIADLMDFVSIEAGKLRIEKAPADVAELLEDLKNRMAALATQKKIALSVEVKTPLPPMEIDKRRIDQVLTNLVTNAFKHTPEGGSVKVAAERIGEIVRLDVIDTGEGIPAADLPRIFEQFYQVETHQSKKEGIGLGLSIAKEIAQAHGGEIGVHSDGPGKGSQFWMTIPLAQKPA